MYRQIQAAYKWMEQRDCCKNATSKWNLRAYTKQSFQMDDQKITKTRKDNCGDKTYTQIHTACAHTHTNKIKTTKTLNLK